MQKEEYLIKLSDSVVNLDDEQAEELSKQYIEDGYDALEGITNGLVDGMNRASQLYEEEEYFITDILLAADALNAGLNVLRPHVSTKDAPVLAKAVIGVIEGDTHDIGKNIVKIMMENAGFEMVDLGKDVPVEMFITKAKEVGASLICLSTLMTTTMLSMKRIIERLEEENMRNNIRVLIGGGPVSQGFADTVGADAYAANANAAVQKAKELVAQLNGK